MGTWPRLAAKKKTKKMAECHKILVERMCNDESATARWVLAALLQHRIKCSLDNDGLDTRLLPR